MCLQTNVDPFAPMSSVIQSFWIVRHTCCKHYFHRIKQSWWLVCSKLPPRQWKVRQYKGSRKHGHWHSRVPKSETKEGVAFSLRLHLATLCYSEATPCILGILRLVISFVEHSVIMEFLSALFHIDLSRAGRGKKLTNGRWEAFWGGYHVFCQGNCQDLHFMPSSPPPSHSLVYRLAKWFKLEILQLAIAMKWLS